MSGGLTAVPAGVGAGADPDPAETVWTIVVAGGTGSRVGTAVPKQYLALGTGRVLDHTLEAVRAVCGDRIVLVVPPDRTSHPEAGLRVVAGGSTRSASVRAGLAAVPADAQVVLVHDAARPLVPVDVFRRVIAAVQAGADAAVPAMPVADTVKRVFNGVVVETLDRTQLVAVQTPQGFRAEVLRRVHVDATDATDDAALVERSGGCVVVVDGHELARKLTTVEDLVWLAAQLSHAASPQHARVGGP